MDFVFQYGNYLLIPVHVIVCLILVAVVLLQTGKGTDWAGVFGGASSQAAFGPRGVENTLSRLTKIAAIVFMVTSFSISLLQSKHRGGGTGLPDLPESAPAQSQQPAVPAPSPDVPSLPAAPAETGAAPGALPAEAPAAGQPAAQPVASPATTP